LKQLRQNDRRIIKNANLKVELARLQKKRAAEDGQ
jgi:hypothetical protein